MDTAFAKLDIVEEMLRSLVAVRNLHQREDFGVHIPITQTEEFQFFGRLLEQRVHQLRKQILSLIWP